MKTLRQLFESSFLSWFFLPPTTILESFPYTPTSIATATTTTTTLSPCVLRLFSWRHINNHEWAMPPRGEVPHHLDAVPVYTSQEFPTYSWRHYILEAQRLLFPIAFSVSSPFFRCLSPCFSVWVLFSVWTFTFQCLCPFTMCKAAHIVPSSLSKNIVQCNNDPVLWRHLPEPKCCTLTEYCLDWLYNWLQIVLQGFRQLFVSDLGPDFRSSLATVLQSQWSWTTTCFPWIKPGVWNSFCWQLIKPSKSIAGWTNSPFSARP